MAFYNPTYPTSNYNSYQAAYSPPPTFSPPPLQPDSPIIWVQGIAGAKAYPVQNNKMVVLFDSEDKRFFIKSTDASGIPQPLRVFDYTESSENKQDAPIVDTSAFITREEFNEAINSLKQSSIKQQNNNDNTQRKDGNKHGKPSVQ